MFKDHTNQRFGRLIVVKERPDLKKQHNYNRVAECLCDCGTIKVIRIKSLTDGDTASCGCLNKERSQAGAIKHGLYYLPEYSIWKGIKKRCYNPKDPFYADYGGRGIIMSNEWKDSAETFYKDMGPRPGPEYSIDRKNNNEGYSKDNCRWATLKEQNNNTRRNILFLYRGETKTLAEWCHLLNLRYGTIWNRLKKGWSFEEAISQISFKLITYDAWNDGKPAETMSLKNWCELLEMDIDTTSLRILRGESFEDIVKE